MEQGPQKNEGGMSSPTRPLGSLSKDVVITPKHEQNFPADIPAVPDNEEGGLVRRVRTYREDILEAVQKQKTSLTSAVAAEERRRTSVSKFAEQVAAEKIDYRKLALVGGGVLLIILGVGLLGYFFLVYEPPQVVIEEEIPSLVFAEARENIDITGKDSRDILQTLGERRRSVSLSLGQIEHLNLTVTEPATNKSRTTTSDEFLKSIGARVSDSFVRSLSPEYMLGIHVFNRNQPFLIFKSQSYQHSFAGMLAWEESIYNDMLTFMGRAAVTPLEIPKNPLTGENIPLTTTFEDRVVQNIDTRALLNEVGDIELLYAFPNQQTLVITTNEHTLTEIITRLNTVRVF